MGEPTDSKVRKLCDITFEDVICRQFPILTTKLHEKCEAIEKLEKEIADWQEKDRLSQKRIKKQTEFIGTLWHVSKVLDRVGPNDQKIIHGLSKDRDDSNKIVKQVFDKQRTRVTKLKQDKKKLKKEKKELEAYAEKCDEVITKQRKIIPIRK